MLITHDMGVIAEAADRVAVMYAGRIAEIGPVRDVIKDAKHPYTSGLMGSIPTLTQEDSRLVQIPGSMPRLTDIPTGCAFNPRCEKAFERCYSDLPEVIETNSREIACHLFDGETKKMSDVLVEIRNLSRRFDVSKPLLNRIIEREEKKFLTAVNDVSFEIRKGETFALVGESGSGKSTIAKLIVGLLGTSAGEILFDGKSLGSRSSADMRQLRSRFQMIFQDPFASLNPRWRVRDIVAEPIRTFTPENTQWENRVGEAA